MGTRARRQQAMTHGRAERQPRGRLPQSRSGRLARQRWSGSARGRLTIPPRILQALRLGGARVDAGSMRADCGSARSAQRLTVVH
jgi:hypothetical protein